MSDKVVEVNEIAEEEEVQPNPWYGTKRYDIVDQIHEKILEKERKGQISPVELAAMRAQAPYKTTSMKELGSSYQGPAKYLKQRDAPLEIPMEVIRNLFVAMDQDTDDRVSVQELVNYVKQNEINVELEKLIEMFNEATSFRKVVLQS